MEFINSWSNLGVTTVYYCRLVDIGKFSIEFKAFSNISFSSGSVPAAPVIIAPKTVDCGVKVENVKVEYCGEYFISILYISNFSLDVYEYTLVLNPSGPRKHLTPDS